MWLKSELGVGTSFFFSLPVAQPAGPTAEPGHQIREDWVWREQGFAASQSAFSDDLLKPRVVVLDPEGSLDSSLSHYSNEVEFVCASGLEAALGKLEQAPAHALMLNTESPDATWALIDSVRKRAPTTPVVGCSVPPTLERAKAAGAVGHLIKPVTRADLARALESVEPPVRLVLVVDDDPAVLQLFRRMLHVCDPTLGVVTARTAADALRLMRSERPDLVLLDIVMPDIDGWGLLEIMSNDPAIRATPTYFVSAQDPASQPPASQFLVASIEGGIPVGKLLRSALTLATVMLQPEVAPSPAPQ
jgi:CheY-like chemotaxis protein